MATTIKPFPNLKGFVFTEKLGQGTYASVYKAYRKAATERDVVAIKCVQKSSLTKSAVENLLTEIAILKKVKSEFIVELKDFQWDSNYIYLIMEYCSGGDLSKFIRLKRKLPESIVQRFLQQIGSALKVMRQTNVCHMDLKPQNILLSCTSEPTLKVADFGFAQYLDVGEEATALRGSLLYMAPEMLLKRQYDARVDLWSLGIILFECLFGKAPFSSQTFTELAEKIKSGKPIEVPYGVELSEECRDLLLRLLKRDPEERITFEEFFNHSFLDMEHMPSQESYKKGVDLIKSAVAADNAGDTAEASKLYCQGLLYLVPLIPWEKDRRKREALRTKVSQYLGRAETLRIILKAGLSSDSPSEGRLASLEVELHNNLIDQTLKDFPDVETSLRVAHEADKQLYSSHYKEALLLYESSLGVIVPLLKDMLPGAKKEALRREANKWLRKAEDAKSLLAVQRLQAQEVVEAVRRGEDIGDPFGDAGSSCVLQ